MLLKKVWFKYLRTSKYLPIDETDSAVSCRLSLSLTKKTSGTPSNYLKFFQYDHWPV